MSIHIEITSQAIGYVCLQTSMNKSDAMDLLQVAISACRLDDTAHRAADEGELAKALKTIVTALDDTPTLIIHGSAGLFQAYHAAKKLLARRAAKEA